MTGPNQEVMHIATTRGGQREYLSTMEARTCALLQNATRHEQRAKALREEACALEAQLRELVLAVRTHDRAVQERWQQRQRLRLFREQLANVRPVQAPGRAVAKWNLDRKRLAAQLRGSLYNVAKPITPGVGGSGCYVLFDGPEVTYVGQAVSVLTRIGQHVGSKRFQRAAFIPCDRHELNGMERLLLDAFLLNP